MTLAEIKSAIKDVTSNATEQETLLALITAENAAVVASEVATITTKQNRYTFFRSISEYSNKTDAELDVILETAQNNGTNVASS